MPIIPTFQVETGRRAAAAGELRPSNLGVEALEQGARNISRLTQERAGLARQVGQSFDRALRETGTGLSELGNQVEQFQGRNEVSAQIPAYAQLHTQVNQQYQDALARHAAGDPNALNNFNNQLENQVSDFEGKATTKAGQQFAQRAGLSLVDHYTSRSTTDLSNIAGALSTAAVENAVNQYTDLSVKDPGSFNANLQALYHSFDTLSQNHDLSPEAQVKLHSTLMQAAGSHMAETTYLHILRGDPLNNIPSNPVAAEQFRQAHADLFTPEQQTALASHAQTQIKFNQEQDRFNRSQQEKQDKEEGINAVSDITKDIFQPGGPQIPPDAMTRLGNAAALPGNRLHPETVNTAFKMIMQVQRDQEAGKLIQDDPATVADLQHRALLPLEDPNHLTYNQLYQARFDGKVSNTTLGFLNQALSRNQKSDFQTQMEAKSTASALTAVQGYLGVTPGTNSAGNISYANFMNWFTPALAAKPENMTTSQFIQQNILSKFGPDGKNTFLDSFKGQQEQNAGGGVYVAPPANPYTPQPNQAGQTVPIPAQTPQNQSILGNVFHSLFGK